MQVWTRFRMRDADLKTKTRPVTQTLKLDAIKQFRSWTFRPSNFEPLKQSKSSHSQMFFEISSLKNFTVFTGKHLSWGLFLIKLWAFRPTNFLKRDSNTGVSWWYCKFSRVVFLYTSGGCLWQSYQQYSNVTALMEQWPSG